METKKLPSGAVLSLTMAPFQDGHRLMKAVAREIEGVKITGDFLKEPDAIKNIIMRAIYSEDVELALKPCLARCSYNKQQITEDAFEDEKARGDFLPVVKEVMVYNLTPFFGSLSSLLKDIKGQVPGQQ